MSQVSCDEFRLRAPTVQRLLQPIEGPAQGGVVAGDLRRKEGHAGPEDSGLHPRDEQRQAEPKGRDLVALALGGACDQPVQAQAPEVVGQPSGRERPGGQPEQGRHVLSELRRGEPVGEQPEDHQRAEEGLHAGVSEAQGRDPLSGDHLRALDR